MIQRQQSLWLLLSAVCAFFSYQFPFFTGTRINESNMTETTELYGASNFFLLVLTGAVMLLAVITIFLFKNRKLQLRLSILGLVLSIALILLYFSQASRFDSYISLWCLFTFAIPVGYLMAIRGIWKDQKLIKSLDKLR